ncbi:glycosyltransferase family 4 protein [Rapidithrix thailandica]|uniref:Glycosyltransferase family 4 protein n=1 Tax=Rapidithrix thailandica TaxID=413964 RepID=A0AAW9SGX4_9BACT
MKIFAFHLLNDYSGSPKVLMQLLKAWANEGLDVTMVTCAGKEGFLSNLEHIQYRYFWYQWAANPFIRLFNLCMSQFLLLVQMILVVRKEDILYVNTVLPFGAAVLGKIKGCRVIYHIHETSVKPPLFKKILFGIVRWAAYDVVYVSKYVANQERVEAKNTYILHNAIENEFIETAVAQRKAKVPDGRVLMVCSLKVYKGVFEFVELAKRHSEYRFRLVVNADQEALDLFFEGTTLPQNLEVFPTQKDVHPFYQWADVILNLSRPDGWVETFGLTILEGMAYGLPAIVPPVGGITELVENQKNGFQVDSRRPQVLSEKLREILSNPSFYAQLQAFALYKINFFKEDIFIRQSLRIFQQSNKTFNKSDLSTNLEPTTSQSILKD